MYDFEIVISILDNLSIQVDFFFIIYVFIISYFPVQQIAIFKLIKT